jgi:outer membrane protein assembly factor BamA
MGLSLVRVRTCVACTLLTLALASLSLDVPASAQAVKTAPYTIHKIVFKGDTPYSAAALEGASGLTVGSALTDAELQAAAERLIATGAFADVGATLDGPKKSVDVVFKIQPTGPEHLLRASFDNFVWFTHEELLAELQRRVPLYNGSLPEGGTLQDSVQQALQQMLVAKGVAGKVSSELVGPQAGRPFRMAEYRVVSPSVRVHQINLAGVPPEFSQATDKAVHGLVGYPYNDGLDGGLSQKILAPYRDAGYQEAALTDFKTSIASTSPERIQVDVTSTVHVGDAYRLSTLTWAGSPQMSSAAFTSAAKLHANDVASQQALRESLENLEAAYRNQGYVDVIVDAARKLDTAAHQVAFVVTAIPGVQYKLKTLTVTGLTPAQRKDFDAAWRLHVGDVYNAGYVKSFLTNNTSVQSLLGLSAGFTVNQDPEAALIDLTVAFHKGDAH